MKNKHSPCIGVCTLKNDVCIGCGRTMTEIRSMFEDACDAYEEANGNSWDDMGFAEDSKKGQ